MISLHWNAALTYGRKGNLKELYFEDVTIQVSLKTIQKNIINCRNIEEI